MLGSGSWKGLVHPVALSGDLGSIHVTWGPVARRCDRAVLRQHLEEGGAWGRRFPSLGEASLMDAAGLGVPEDRCLHP